MGKIQKRLNSRLIYFAAAVLALVLIACFVLAYDQLKTAGSGNRATLSTFGIISTTAPIFNFGLAICGILISLYALYIKKYFKNEKEMIWQSVFLGGISFVLTGLVSLNISSPVHWFFAIFGFFCISVATLQVRNILKKRGHILFAVSTFLCMLILFSHSAIFFVPKSAYIFQISLLLLYIGALFYPINWLIKSGRE